MQPGSHRAMTVRAVRAAPRAWLFGEGDFRRLWLVGVVVFAVRWLEMLAVAVFAYQHTGSPFIVALLTMLRMLPMALFGALVGALAERLERRTALIVVVVSMLLSSLVLALLAWSGTLEVWHVALASFVNGIAWTTDNPVRRTMIGEVVGPERMSAAMSLDVGANNASRMLGPTVGNLVLAITLTAIAPFARIARAPTLTIKERDFIEAGRALGFSNLRIMLVHILPNIIDEILVMASLWLATAIRTEASLSFIGLGVRPPTATWGGMIREGFENILDSPWLALFPSLAILVIMLGLNMLGDGLRDATDPRLRHE